MITATMVTNLVSIDIQLWLMLLRLPIDLFTILYATGVRKTSGNGDLQSEIPGEQLWISKTTGPQ